MEEQSQLVMLLDLAQTEVAPEVASKSSVPSF